MNRWQYQSQVALRENGGRSVSRQSLTPRWDRLTSEQKRNLADRSIPLPEGITPEALLVECGRLWTLGIMVRNGDL